MDYSIGIVILPMGAVGATAGAIVGLILPEPIIIGVLTTMLIYIFVKTTTKWLSMRKNENAALIAKVHTQIQELVPVETAKDNPQKGVDN